MNKNELSKRIDVSLKTLYNWEDTKPELINLIKLGLQKEQELQNNNNKIDTEEIISKITNNLNLSLDEMLNRHFLKKEREKKGNIDELNNFIEEKKAELNRIFEKVKNDR
ncbi:hypothetical protein [Aliarcobacter butzleri]|uniref:hypothetical protein n=1 Tax=Aliarcobacter butzleri TaxID=28197 RepID=UPI003AF4CEA1